MKPKQYIYFIWIFPLPLIAMERVSNKNDFKNSKHFKIVPDVILTKQETTDTIAALQSLHQQFEKALLADTEYFWASPKLLFHILIVSGVNILKKIRS